MNQGINRLSHADIIAVVKQVENHSFRSDQEITCKNRTVKPQELRTSLPDALDNVSETAPKERSLRVTGNGISTGGDEQRKPMQANPLITPTQCLLMRQRMGGKGQFLDLMHKAGIPVPAFYAIETQLLQSVEELPITLELLRKYLPGAVEIDADLSLAAVKQMIVRYDAINQAKWLGALSQLMTSDEFVQQVTALPAAVTIRERYQQLIASDPSQPVIVRSSGVNEDDYGNAQAGKYDSVVHGAGDIVKTCLQVLASGYQPALEGVVQPMAVIMQLYLNCRFGGVVISHQSLQDDTITIEYAPGQPRGAVAGNTGITPHRYQVERQSGKVRWRKGHIPRWFELRKRPDGCTEEEVSREARAKKPGKKLPHSVLKQLQRHIVQLEDMIGCPVDIEFAVDRSDRLYLVQVRPVSALAGGASFTCRPPDEYLCTGQLVSEGLSAGPLLWLDRPPAKPVPGGAIIQAGHAEDWMLEPAFLKRAGGFVFRYGGNNDHAAITLRQAGKPCLVGEFKRMTHGEPVTLVAGNFAGTSGAYLLSGNHGEQWRGLHAALDLDYTSALAAVDSYKQSVPTFCSPDQGFQWLQAQNARLLNYFLPTRLMHQCLTPGQSKALSMSGQRTEVLRAFKTEMEHFFADARALLDGYQHFLQLADGSEPAIRKLMGELQPLRDSLATIQAGAMSQETALTDPDRPVSFAQWLKDAQGLKNSLQRLNLPDLPGQIRTVHDFIYFIHRRFTEALESVAIHSGQGSIKKAGCVTITCFPAPANGKNLLTDSLLRAVRAMNAIYVKVLDMRSACIVNARLGVHMCSLEMFEQAETGKGGRLRLVFTDSIDVSRSRAHQGRLKRMWFVAHFILSMSGAGVKISLNPSAAALTVEMPYIESTQVMQQTFLTLTRLLAFVKNLDAAVVTNITGSDEAWDFVTVRKMIDKSTDSLEANHWPYKVCLLNQGTRGYEPGIDLLQDKISTEDQVFFQAGKVFGKLIDYFEATKREVEPSLKLNPEKIGQLLTDLTQNLPATAIDRVKRELSLILFGSFPEEFIAYMQQQYPDDMADYRLLKSLPTSEYRFDRVLRNNVNVYGPMFLLSRMRFLFGK